MSARNKLTRLAASARRAYRWNVHLWAHRQDWDPKIVVEQIDKSVQLALKTKSRYACLRNSLAPSRPRDTQTLYREIFNRKLVGDLGSARWKRRRKRILGNA